MPQLAYRRILLKLSGEALGKRGGGIDAKRILNTVKIIKSAYKTGAELGIVVGGGNWWRKREGDKSIKPQVSDYMGMIGTVLNGLALANYLENVGVKTLLQSYLVTAPGITVVNARDARRALGQKKVVIFAGGTGKPFVTTDTAAAYQARNIKAAAIFKVGQVDGVYTADPDKNKNAKKFKQVTFKEARKRGLKIFDRNAYSICEKAGIPVIVFKWSRVNLLNALSGKNPGTTIS